MKNQTNWVRQTAGNNAYLKAARATWNDPIYKKVLQIFNDDGYNAAQRYLQQFTTVPLPLDLEPTLTETPPPTAEEVRDAQCGALWADMDDYTENEPAYTKGEALQIAIDDKERYEEQEAARSLRALQVAAQNSRRCTFSRLARLTEELRDEVLDASDDHYQDDEAVEIAVTLLKQIENCFRRRA